MRYDQTRALPSRFSTQPPPSLTISTRTPSSRSAFLSKVQPKTSVIEVGAGNSCGHPTSATLSRLAQVGSAVYRTDLNGDVTVTTDRSTYDVKTGQTGSQPTAVIAKTVTTQQTVSSQISAGAVCDCSYN